jgi:hypothetical protein
LLTCGASRTIKNKLGLTAKQEVRRWKDRVETGGEVRVGSRGEEEGNGGERREDGMRRSKKGKTKKRER